MSERLEWVEIVEPRTREHMYANLITGECVWEPPRDAKFKKAGVDQWWELYDRNTSRFYYYNATTQRTAWHRPNNSDIIPLAKLQTLKQNTEVGGLERRVTAGTKRETSTQTSTSCQSKRDQIGRSGYNPSAAAAASSNKQFTHHPSPHTQAPLPSSPLNKPAPGPWHNHAHMPSHIVGPSHNDDVFLYRPPAVAQGYDDSMISYRGLGSNLRQDSFPLTHQISSVAAMSSLYDNPLDFAIDYRPSPRGQQQQQRYLDDSVRLSAVRSRPRAFPRTNPSFISTSGGARRLQGPQQQQPINIYNQQLYDNYPPPPPVSINQRVDGAVDRRLAFRHDRSDSETSHSSTFGLTRLTREDSGGGAARSPQCGGVRRGFRSRGNTAGSTTSGEAHLSDGHSSVGSFRSVGENMSSVGSLNRDSEVGCQQEVGLPTAGSPLHHITASSPLHRNQAAISAGGRKHSHQRDHNSSSSLDVDLRMFELDELTANGRADRGANQSEMRARHGPAHPMAEPRGTASGHGNIRSRHGSEPDYAYIGDSELSVAGEAADTRGITPGDSRGYSKPVAIKNIDSRGQKPTDFRALKSFDSRSQQISESKVKKSTELRDQNADSRGQQFVNARSHQSTDLGGYRPPDPGTYPPTDGLMKAPARRKHLEGRRVDKGGSSGDELESMGSQMEERSDHSLHSTGSLSPTTHLTGSLSPTFVLPPAGPDVLRSSRTPDSMRSAESIPSRESNDAGFEDSDNSSMLSSPSPRNRQRHKPLSLSSTNHSASMSKQVEPSSGVGSDTQDLIDSSDRPTADRPTADRPTADRPTVERSRPMSQLLSSQSDDEIMSSVAASDRSNKQIPSLDDFILENLNEHRKGLLGRTVPIGNLLTWTKDLIAKPMIKTSDKVVKKEAVEVFKLIQTYMGDRKSKSGHQSRQQIALEIVTKGWSNVELRDEVYMQLCRQTSDNPRDESLRLGWELMCVCLSIFPPSIRFQPYLETYIYRHLDPEIDVESIGVSHFARHSQKRLERISRCGAKRGVKKPTSEEVEQATACIWEQSMFGNTLDEIMALQAERYPDRQLPWIQTMLSEEILRLNGTQTEGIFRVPGDIDEVNEKKVECDRWVDLTACSEPHTPASLLKLWYRELYEPLIPPQFYESCVNNCNEPEAALNIVQQLPHINRLVLAYLIRFLQVFASEENALITKMDVNNLAMVMAPNCLRCESEEPSVIFENTRKEMAFIRTLIQHLDTSFMDGII